MRIPVLATHSVKGLAVPLLLARVIAGVRPGRGRVRSLAVAAAGTVLALGLFAAPAGAATVSITLRPGAGPPTTKVSVTGTGFGASETVAVDFGPAQVATASTSSTGTFTATFAVPKSALPGRHPVTATGQASGLSATANFRVRTNWAKPRFDLGNSGYNPYENAIRPSNVSGLKKAWTAATNNFFNASPVVSNGVTYAYTDDELFAYSAAGTTGCSGTHKTCKPLWTAATNGDDPNSTTSPTVANGVVYVASSFPDENTLYAFSAAGTTGCSGTHKTCKPLWTAAINGFPGGSATVANGVVYIGSSDGDLYGFSAAGTTGCSGTPKTCKPLWAGAAGDGAGASPAVVNGVVYVTGGGELYAFRAAGTTGCSGTPKTCKPMWTATAGYIDTPTAVVNGVVYVGTGTSLLAAFSAAGTTGCSGTPKTCKPLWTAAGSNPGWFPAVANGVVYVTGDGKLYAFSAAGTTNCSGTPPRKRCSPLWTGAGRWDIQSSPAVANGVVYVGATDSKVYAFSAAGTAGCSGTPKTCKPVWAATTNVLGYNDTDPVVANGMVYVGSSDTKLYAFSR